MSRLLLALGVVLSLLATSAASIVAQGTPEAASGLLSELDYPEAVVTASEAGFEVPADVPAGPVLLTLENTAPFPMGFSLVQLPEGVSLEELMPPPSEEDASPVAEEGAAPEEEFPPVLYDATWAGGAFAMPGSTAQSVVFLTEGEWVMLTPPDAGAPPAVMTVSGEAEGAIEGPADAVTVELDNFEVRLPEQLPAGPQVWHATNVGDQPHEIFITQTPERLTVEEALALVQMDPEAEPDPSLPNPEEFIDVGFVLPISQDQSTLIELNLEPGHYVAVCFMPTQDEDVPHAFKGMVTVFSIGAEGEQVEPPASPVPEEHAGH